MGVFASFVATMRNVFRPQTTEPLPWNAVRPRPERFHASFCLTHDENGEENCTGCKMCEKICPSTIITVTATGRRESPVTGKKRGYSSDFTLDLNACIACELCVQVCPTDSIIMLKTLEPVGYSREDLFLSMEKLYANEGLAQSWATGTRLLAMQDPKRGTEKS